MDKRMIRAVMLATMAPMLMGASCEPVVKDSSFELWCGDQLCAWSTDSGSVRRVATWHEKDFGVELVGDGARISQRSDLDDSTGCLRFELTAEIEDRASLVVEMDFFDDGKVDFSQIVPSAGWAPLHFDVPTPTSYRGVRFIVRKTGTGRAILAQLDVSKGGDCTSARPTLTDRPLGAECATEAGGADPGLCASALCDTRAGAGAPTCGACQDDTGCSAGQACGVESSGGRYLHLGCGAAGRHGIGERCVAGTECASGVCCGGVCSECCAGTGPACSGGRACSRIPFDPQIKLLRLPSLCAPGQGTGVAGAPCVGASDCASGRCAGAGTLSACQGDGRRCSTNDECHVQPVGEFGQNCIAIGTAGGRCE